MTNNKQHFFSGLVVLAIVVGVLLGQHLWKWGNARSEVTPRTVTLVDTRAERTTHKSQVYFNTYGYFVDEQTKAYFRDSINDRLYTEFTIIGEFKPKKMTWLASYDKVNQTSRGTFYEMTAILIWIISGFFGLWWFFGRDKETDSDKPNWRHPA